jgi:methylmalonyl-CoA/ethylmalonyl-CoA epimerase
MSRRRTQLTFHHAGISVPSLDDATRWWSDMLGFEVDQNIDIPAIPARIAMLKRGGLRIELFEVPGAEPLPAARSDMHADLHTHGHKHVAFAVEDVDAIVEEMRARGADIVMTKRAPWGAFLFIRDNVGNLIEFVEQPDVFRCRS